MQTSPTDFELALFSAHTYYADCRVEEGTIIQFPPGSLERYNSHLVKWKVTYVHYAPEANNYLGILYGNSDTNQLVLAQRGTSLSLHDFIGNSFANLKGVVFGETIPMQEAAAVMTKKACEVSIELGYDLSFTGHSLGGWLAVQSIAHPEAEAVPVVTFDAPGTKQVLDRLGATDISDRVKHYLTYPNMVSSCGEHVGEMWQIKTERDWGTEWVKHLAPVISPFTTSGHCMESILGIFDKSTGRPSACEKIASWPTYQFANTHMGDVMKNKVEWVWGEGLLSHTTKVCVSMMFGEVHATSYYRAFEDNEGAIAQATGLVGELCIADLIVM
jgi:hypothetical protein